MQEVNGASVDGQRQNRPRIHYVVNARMPHVRAYAIQIAKMCEAYIEAGVDLTLVVPRTHNSQNSMRAHNYLRVDVPTAVIPGLDWYDRGRAGFLLSSLVFMISSFLYLRRERRRGRLHAIYTVDTDRFSYTLLPLLGVPCFIEMHGAKSRSLSRSFFFRRVAGIIATNDEIRDALIQTFSIPREKILVEPNGVDVRQFETRPSKEDARRRLSLPSGETAALYMGRFYPWKGLDILLKAAPMRPEIGFFVVGGTVKQFVEATGSTNMPPNVHIIEACASDQVPLWLAAADVLLLLGTKTNEESNRFTAPMKVYEYMAARRPVLASATPALKSFVEGDCVRWYEPDNAADFARVLSSILTDPAVSAMVERAAHVAPAHSWANRARRIIDAFSPYL